MTAKRSQSPKLGCPPVWVGLQTSHVLGLVVCTQEQGSQWSPTFCAKLLQFGFPASPPKAWEEKAEAREGRARTLSQLTNSSSTRRRQGRETLENKMSTSHWFQGTGWGSRNGTGPDRRQVHQSVSHHFIKF